MAQWWKTVPGWPSYEVAASGKVRSIDRILPDGRRCGGQVLTPTVNSHGYPVVTLRDGKRRRTAQVHVLVMTEFEGPCPEGMEIAHGAAGQQCPALWNLRYATHSENEQDKKQDTGNRTGKIEQAGEQRKTGETGRGSRDLSHGRMSQVSQVRHLGHSQAPDQRFVPGTPGTCPR